MISFKSSLEDIVVLDPENPLWIAAASVVVDTTAVNLSGIKMLLPNDLSTFLSKGNPVLVMVLKFYLKFFLSVLRCLIQGFNWYIIWT